MPGARGITNGWGIWAAVTMAVASASVCVLAWHGYGEDGVRSVLRLTARSSLVLFSSAFIASSVCRLHHSNASAWLLRYRRYLGLAFASSHGIHGLAILDLLRMTDGSPDPVTVLIGGTAYAFILAMAITSFDRTAVWLDARRWRRLHLLGSYTIWFVFFVTYAPNAGRSPIALGAVLLLVAGLVLRAAARIRASPPAASA